MEIDGKEITGMYLGDQEISNAYAGDKEVFSKAPAGPLYAAYKFSGIWAYAKYPLDGSNMVYMTSSGSQASSSSQLTNSASGATITEEKIVHAGWTYWRDTAGDLYS